jgi:DNA-binding NarL/FixJ family response regulator
MQMTLSPEKFLLIVDDHPVYRDALYEKLSRDLASLNIKVIACGSATDGLETLQHSPHTWVVLLDILMPGLSGLACIKVFKDLAQVSHVIALSGLDEQAWESKAIAAGATMFLSKNSTSQTISQKILPLLDATVQKPQPHNDNTSHSYRLTKRQLEVLDLIAQGHPNKIIADYLSISEQTVKIHINQIFKELRVFNRTQAVLKAQQIRELIGS